jgi:hypothetical protein
MATIVSLGGAASIALVVIGLLPVPALFVPAVMAVGVMGIAGAMARGRMERYHPAAGEAKDVREGQYESAFKFAGFVLPIFIPQSAEKVGVTFTSVVLGVLTAVSTLAVWMVLRGEGATVQPRAPPAIRETLRGGIAQIIATPRGLLRALASVPLFTLVTGLYATSLGGVMIDQIVTVNDPTHAVFTTATAVTVLVTVRGFVAQFVGPLWAPVKRLLGTPLGRSAPGTVIDESRVLTGVANLAFVLAAPLAWYVLAPGLVSFGAVLTVGAIVSSFARLPTGRWKEGGTGAALNLTAKAGSNALAAVLMAFALGDVAARVTGRMKAGLPYADLVAATNHRLVLLAVPILLVPALLARAIAALRAGPLDTLRDRLVTAGLDVAAAAGITGKLSARGVDDIGSARALFVDDGWAPRWAARWRNGLRLERQRSVELTAAELAALLEVLDTAGGRPGRTARAWRDGRTRSPGAGPRRGSSGGTRKPHGGAGLDAYAFHTLDDSPISQVGRRAFADELEAQLRTTPAPESFPALHRELRSMVNASIALLRGGPLDHRWSDARPFVLHLLSPDRRADLIDIGVDLPIDAAHTVRDGVVHIYASDATGLLHELVEAVLAPAGGIAPEQAHTIATLAERLVDQPMPDVVGDSARQPRRGWLTRRAGVEIDWLARHREDTRNLMVLQYPQVLADIAGRFENSPWLDLVMSYAEEFHLALLHAAHPMKADPAALAVEFDLAIAEIREFGARYEGDNRWKIRRALRRARPEPHVEQIEKMLGELRAATETEGLALSRNQLLAVSVRLAVWEELAAKLPYDRVVVAEAADNLYGRWPQVAPALGRDRHCSRIWRHLRFLDGLLAMKLAHADPSAVEP